MTENSISVRPDLSETSLLRWNKDVLDLLLKDRTTGKNIRWGTDNYNNPMLGFESHAEMKVNLITGWYDGLIRPRAEKDNETQIERTKNKAEVFTPSWVIKMQVDAVLEDFSDLSLEEFLHTKWLEITCGEAPYMANRYDMITGKINALDDRAGFMDVKFQRLHNEVDDHDTWVKLALMIYQSSYGYEYQGDSLLLARENLLLTFMDNYFYQFGAPPSDDLLIEITEIISKNVIQMDGLSYEIPYTDGSINTQLGFFHGIDEEYTKPTDAEIYRWDLQKKIKFKDITKGGKEVKFDVVIGNPPYQKTTKGNNRDVPVYPYFMDESYKIGQKVLLITPARFLSNAGQTAKLWNQKMLSDEHLKVLYFEQFSGNVFDGTDIKGGVAITYRDATINFGAIKTFVRSDSMHTIVEKVLTKEPQSINIIHHNRSSYRLTPEVYDTYPELKLRVKKSERLSITSNIFDKFPELFENQYSSNCNIVSVVGRQNNERVTKYIRTEFIQSHPALDKWKVFVAKSNGTGAIGETLSEPIIGSKNTIATQTFITLGNFDTEIEANNLHKYLHTKFLRIMLSVKKATPDNARKEVWQYVPLQDFTPNADIDWTQSIPEIDQQLYTKYNLSDEEIDFIETHVKEME